MLHLLALSALDNGGSLHPEEDGEFEDGMFDDEDDEDGEVRVEVPELGDKPSADDIIRNLRAIRERTRQDDQRDDELRTDLDKVVTAMRKAKEQALDPSPEWRGGAGSERELKHYVAGDDDVLLAASEDQSEPHYLTERALLTDEPVCRWQRDFQHWWAVRAVARAHMVTSKLNGGHIRAHQAPHAKVTPKLDATIRELAGRCPDPSLRKALAKIFDDSTSTGGDWIPTQDLVPGLIEPMIGFGGAVANAFQQNTAMHGRVDLPAALSVPTPYRHGIPTSDTPGQFKAATLGTTTRSDTLDGIAVRQVASLDAMEDALVSSAPVLLRYALLGLIYACDDAAINSDTAGTHQDTGLATWNPASAYSAAPGGAADDHRTMWLGWRAEALDNSTGLDTSGSWTWDNFVATLALLDGGQMLNQVLAISSIGAGLESMKWDEFQGLDKVGTSSVLTAASLPNAIGLMKGGVPFMISPFMTDDTNASGVYDGVTTTQGGCLLVARGAYGFWSDRRGVISGTDDDITRGIRHVVTRVRKVLLKLYAAGDKTCAYAYNI